MINSILRKAGEKIFEELMKGKISEFEARIKVLEKEVEIMRTYIQDLKDHNKEVQEELKQTYKMTSKMEGIIQTVLMLADRQTKKLDDGNDK